MHNKVIKSKGLALLAAPIGGGVETQGDAEGLQKSTLYSSTVEQAS